MLQKPNAITKCDPIFRQGKQHKDGGNLSRFYKLYHCYFINCTGSIQEDVLILRKNPFRNKVYSHGSENNVLCIWHIHLKCGNVVKTMQEFLLLVVT